MQKIQSIPQIETDRRSRWHYYVYDGLLAVVGSLLITGVIYYSKLYPRVPDIVLFHLVWITVLATMRSRYAAIVAAVATFFSFDYFLVPPLYTLQIADPVQWITLFIFLIVAIITSQLAGAARRNVEEARQNERELRILYEVMQVCNTTDDFDDQLDIIALSTMRVFSSIGVKECAILSPDQDGVLRVLADAPIRIDEFAPTPQELQIASSVCKTGVRAVVQDEPKSHSMVHFIPLHVGSHVFCVLYLRVRDGVAWLKSEEAMRSALAANSAQAEFFWTFLDQVSSLIERSLLRKKFMNV